MRYRDALNCIGRKPQEANEGKCQGVRDIMMPIFKPMAIHYRFQSKNDTNCFGRDTCNVCWILLNSYCVFKSCMLPIVENNNMFNKDTGKRKI